MKKKNVYKIVIVAFTLFFVLPSMTLAQPSERLKADEGNQDYEVTCTMRFSPEDVLFETLKGYDTILLPECTSSMDPGKPMVPMKQLRLALPEDMRATTVQILDIQREQLPGNYHVFPVQPPQQVSTFTKQDSALLIDQEVYASNYMYPGDVVVLVGQTDFAGQGIAVLEVYPVQYQPAEHTLSMVTSITFTVQGESGYRCGDYLPLSLSAAEYEEFLSKTKEMVYNPEDVILQMSDGPLSAGVEPGDYDYVIITQSSWVDDFQPLMEWKTKKGIPATIVTMDWIYNDGGYSGTNQNKIRLFVQDARSNWGTMYFLLGGDTNIIPYYSKYVLGDNIPNDTYYGDYDADWTCEVHVGRASVRTEYMIDVFIDKILTYEKNPPLTSYATTAGLFGFDLYTYGSGEGEDCKQDIDSLYIPNDWTLRKEYDSESGGHKYDVIGYLNQGNNLVNHIDHCGEYSLGVGYTNHGTSLSNSDVSNLYNGDRQSIFYSIGCWPAAYDYYTCIAEEFVQNAAGGGIAFVGNSRYGWYQPYSDDGVSLRFDRYFFRSLLQQGNYKLGEAFSDHKNDAYQYDDYYRYIFTELTLLGDPELPIWTDDPTPMTVDHDDTITEDVETEFVVEVQDNGNPVLLATVCLWKDDEIYEVRVTDGYGKASFTITPETTGIMDVTVTAVNRNLLPYEGQVEVIEGGSIPGDINGDGVVNTEDLLMLLGAWGNPGGPEDINGDGTVNTEDLLILLGNWG